jgi:hypothetical protein
MKDEHAMFNPHDFCACDNRGYRYHYHMPPATDPDTICLAGHLHTDLRCFAFHPISQARVIVEDTGSMATTITSRGYATALTSRFNLNLVKTLLFYYVLSTYALKAQRHLVARGIVTSVKEVYTSITKVRALNLGAKSDAEQGVLSCFL